MIRFFKHSLHRVSVQLAFISFIIGHLLLLIYLFYPEEIMIGFAIAFLIIFIGLHTALILILLVNLLANFKHYEEHMVALVLVFLNVPLALFYLSLF